VKITVLRKGRAGLVLIEQALVTDAVNRSAEAKRSVRNFKVVKFYFLR